MGSPTKTTKRSRVGHMYKHTRSCIASLPVYKVPLTAFVYTMFSQNKKIRISGFVFLSTGTVNLCLYSKSLITCSH